MLLVTYWEFNENMSEAERQQIAQKRVSSGVFPSESVNIIRWDVTPDGWGICVLEAETGDAAMRSVAVWRASGAGFFKSTKTSPAMPVQEGMSLPGEILNVLASTSYHGNL